MSYFEELQQDWDTLGFNHDTPIVAINFIEPRDVRSYSLLFAAVLNLSRNIVAAHDPTSNFEPSAQESELVTQLGKRMLFLCRTKNQGHASTRTCQDAEPHIANSLNPNTVTDNDQQSPIVVTRNDQAVGVIKQLGDRNYYALRDDPTSNTYAGNIYLGSSTYFVDQERVRHAWTIPMDEVRSQISTARRLSTFTIPQYARMQLAHTLESAPAVSTSHETLVEHADQALEHAKRTNVEMLYPFRETV